MLRMFLMIAFFGTASIQPVLAQDLRVSITYPDTGSQVPRNPTAEGAVSSAGVTVWTIVHPMAVEEFWVQPKPKVDAQGNWEGPVYFGRPGRLDIGKEFEIRAVANPRGPLQEGMTLDGWPDAEARSRIVRVVRR